MPVLSGLGGSRNVPFCFGVSCQPGGLVLGTRGALRAMSVLPVVTKPQWFSLSPGKPKPLLLPVPVLVSQPRDDCVPLLPYPKL